MGVLRCSGLDSRSRGNDRARRDYGTGRCQFAFGSCLALQVFPGLYTSWMNLLQPPLLCLGGQMRGKALTLALCQRERGRKTPL